ncbi:protein ACCELERATED CELL DEATH 6-like [Populus alba x Populus x berolinensis]|uniref:Protein ACCELERATED CELL DEATH 6-like n=1 Tax=Populus alba x Populus x berolinensis TaxID=444605 RepID=A0AAD6L9A8_9ROSI|nr:protein ACCELERATED CELL DEATH 6-like [Populus alba x Populus x berolinensis]
MELSINISGQASNQRDENVRQWKAESFPPQIPRDGDPKKMMDEKLYKYAEEDKFDELFGELRRVSAAELSSIIYTQVSPSGNSLLHVSASNGSKHVTELLLQHFPLLMMRKNFHDDTALHLAAGAGQLGTTTVLINKAKGHGGASHFPNFLEMKNDRGNTALHDAVINGHDSLAHFLVSESSKLLYTENNERKSPLYLAVENSDEKMLTTLMDTIPDDVDLLNKLEGKSPVHAAVQGKKRAILEQIAKKKPGLLRRKDEKGENPLHCAASMGYVWETQFLFDKYRDGAIQQNDEGNMPIHVASKKGYVDVVDAYISKWTYPAEFLNSKRQNILHVAAESGRYRVVKYILGNKNLEALINKQDLDGNTPLHLASKNGRSITAFTLVRNSMVMKDKANGENLTPYEVAKKQSKMVEAEFSGEPILNGKDNNVDPKSGDSNPKSDDKREKPQTKDKPDHGVGNQVGPDDRKGGKKNLGFYEAMMTLSILHFWAGPKRSKAEYLRIKGRPLPKEEIKGRIDSLLVVAVLIAGATFAGVLQLPKSGASNITTNSTYNQSISEQNEDILRNVYIFSDMVALNSAVMASIILCWAQLYDVKVAAHAVWLASILTGGAIYWMCIAFVFAVAIDVGKSFAFFVVAIAVGGAFFLFQTLVSIPLIIPPSANQIIERIASPRIYLLIFYLHFVLDCLSFKLKKTEKPQQTTSS